MRPVTVSIDVPQAPEVVYDHLDVMANHEAFTNHFLTDWRYSGPQRGIGSAAAVTAVLGGRSADATIEVVEVESPCRIVERNASADGKRAGRGTYVLAPAPDGGTHVTFEYAWLRAPLGDRLAGPLARAMIRRANRTAMQRLAVELATRERSASMSG